MFNLKIGDKVRFLSEVGTAVIISLDQEKAKVCDDHGFEYDYPLNQLVPELEIDLDVPLNIKDHDLSSRSKKASETPTIDLHIENLIDSSRGLSSHDKLMIQITSFKKFMLENEEKKIGRFLVIHGAGSGRLKTELKTMIQGIPGASMSDANFTQNGVGASWIERKYNWR